MKNTRVYTNRGTRWILAAAAALASAALLAPTPVLAEAIPQETESGWRVTFRLDASDWDDKPQTASVAGTFNGWNAGTHPMRDVGGGVWEADVPMAQGRQQYKFVIDGGRWITDPTDDAELRVGDNYGGENSGVIVGPDVRKAPPPEDGAIRTEFVLHDSANPLDARPHDVNTVMIRVRTQADDVREVIARVVGVDAVDPAPLVLGGRSEGYDVWTGLLEVPGDRHLDAVLYTIEVADGPTRVVLSASGVGDVAADAEAFEVAMPAFDIPEWAKHAVWYQIFTERFRNGDTSNDPGRFDYETLVPWDSDWWDVLPGETAPTLESDNFYTGTGDVWDRRYGGDLQGVKEKLPYLRELGVTAIYFNPIFEGESMHKYDTADFVHVDDNFGVLHDATDYPPRFEGETHDPETWVWSPSDEVFLDFLKEAKAQGFRVIVDGVFNHVGRAHPYFQDVLEKGQESEYADWFEITDWGTGGEPGTPGGIRWAAWDNPDGALPAFRKDPVLGLAEGPRHHIFDITRRWMDPDGDPTTDDGIDGWRLDVPNDIPHPFWVDWRKVVKEANPDAYITGEIWSWADAWLTGDQFDAVMNYQFAMAAQDFFVNDERADSPTVFLDRLVELTERYPRPITYVMQNLMGSHDTDRLASMFVNPDRPYDGANRPQDNARDFDPPYDKREPTPEEWRNVLQLVMFKHTFVGAPMTYYGDEAGMWSPDDPSNRQPFPWPDKGSWDVSSSNGFNDEVFAGYQRAMAMRNSVPVLRTGDFVPIRADDEAGVVAFARSGDDGLVYVVINRGGEASMTVEVEPGRYVDFASSDETRLVMDDAPDARPRLEATAPGRVADGSLRLTLPERGIAVLVRQ